MKPLVMALPKGRIFDKALDHLSATAGIEPLENPSHSRKLFIATNRPELQLCKVRNTDVLVCIESGAADLAIVGSDSLSENYPAYCDDLYALDIAKCWLKVAVPKGYQRKGGRVRVATKFVNLAKRYYASIGVQATIVKLYGSVELAVHMQIADEIVDLVETGTTLAENGLVPTETIMQVSSHLVANSNSLITKYKPMREIIELCNPANLYTGVPSDKHNE